MEIETVLHGHPAIKDVAVVGIDHEVLGEDIAAAVTFKAEMSATITELAAYAREHLADNKVPRTIMVLDELPLNQTGKVLKRELKPLLQQEAHHLPAECARSAAGDLDRAESAFAIARQRQQLDQIHAPFQDH